MPPTLRPSRLRNTAARAGHILLVASLIAMFASACGDDDSVPMLLADGGDVDTGVSPMIDSGVDGNVSTEDASVDAATDAGGLCGLGETECFGDCCTGVGCCGGQIGEFAIVLVAAPSETMVSGAPLTLSWDVTALTSLPDGVSLLLDLANVVGGSAAQWREALVESPLAPVSFAPGETRRVTLTTVSPYLAESADLALRVVSGRGGVESTSPVVRWRAGEPLVTPSPNAVVTFGLPDGGADFNGAAVDIGGITVRGIRVRGGSAEGLVEVEVQDTRLAGAAATYEISLVFETNAAAWTVTRGPVPARFVDLLAGDDRSFGFGLQNLSGDAGEVTMLRVEVRQTATGTDLEPYTSFVVIPLQLF